MDRVLAEIVKGKPCAISTVCEPRGLQNYRYIVSKSDAEAGDASLRSEVRL